MRKIALNWSFFVHLLLNWYENRLLAACIANLSRIHEKKFKLSCPQLAQVNVNADADDAELQLR